MIIKKAIYPIFIMLIFLLASCTTPRQAAPILSLQPTSKAPIDKTEYSVYINGQYNRTDNIKPPSFTGGISNFYRIVYSNLKYPENAQKQRIQGQVIVTLTLNELGLLEDSVIKKGIGNGCDKEALRAIKLGIKTVMKPAILNEKAVKVRFDIPINFKLFP